MSAHRQSIDRSSAEGSRSEAAVCSEIMCYSCDITEHLANDLPCPNMTPRSWAVMQQRTETFDDAQIRELLELRAERALMNLKPQVTVSCTTVRLVPDDKSI